MGTMSGGADVVGQLGPLPIYVFGLAAALGFAVGTAVSLAQAARWGAPAERLFPAAPLVMAAGVLGARTAYVVAHWPDYRYDLAAVLRLHEGGFVYYGAVAAGAAVLAWYARRVGWNGWRALDAAAPGLALGQAVGLIGAQMPGQPTDVPWAVPVGDVLVHPLPAYGIILCYWLFFVLWRLGRRVRRPGRLFLVYLFLHGLGWAVIGIWDAGPRWAGLAPSQWSGILVALAAMAGLLLLPHEGAIPAATGAPGQEGAPSGSLFTSTPAVSRTERPADRLWRTGGWLVGLVVLLGLYGLRWI